MDISNLVADDKKQGFSFDSVFKMFEEIPEIPEENLEIKDFSGLPPMSDEDDNFNFDVPATPDEEVSVEIEEEDIDENAADDEGGDEGGDGGGDEDGGE